jgi:hypothetical protein
VHSVQKAFERFDGSQWISIGGDHRDFPAIGQVRCNPMRGLVGGVAGFIDRSLGKLMFYEKTQEKGITLALRLLRSCYAQDFIESQGSGSV